VQNDIFPIKFNMFVSREKLTKDCRQPRIEGRIVKNNPNTTRNFAEDK
jgi:hypothetical protein